MTETRSDSRHVDDGFTLVELIVVVVLMGLVTSAVAFAAMIVLRTSPLTNDNIDEAAAQRSMTTWLSRDLASAPGRPYDNMLGGLSHGDVVGRCAPAPAGTKANVVSMAWSIEQISGEPSFRAVDYWLVDQGATSQLIRTSCRGPSFTSLGASIGQVMLAGEFESIGDQPEPTATFSGSIRYVDIALELANGPGTISISLSPRGRVRT